MTMSKLFILASFLAAVSSSPPVSDAPGWKRAAEMLHAAMDESADPCDDFYKFACGNWIKTHEIPPFLTQYDPIYEMSIQVFKNISNLFKNMNPKTRPRAVQQAKIYFDACMGGTTHGDDVGYILKLLSGYGNWPAVNQNWTGPIGGAGLGSASALIGRLLGTVGAKTFVSGEPMADWNQPKRLILFLTPAYPLVSPTSPVNQTVNQITDIAKTLAKAGGISLDSKQLEKDATELANLEMTLAKIYGRPNLNFPYPYNIFNASMAQKKWPYFDWTVLLSKMSQDNIGPEKMLQQPLLVPLFEQFDKLSAVVKNMSERTMQNFLLWRLVYLEISKLPKFAKYRDAFYTLKENTLEAWPQDLTCARQTLMHLPWATGRVYVDDWRSWTPESTASTLNDMIAYIMGAFRGMLYDLSWMDAASKKAAFEKITNLVRNVAYNNFVVDDALLNKLYAELDLKATDDTFVTINKVLQFSVWTDLNTLGKPVDRTNMEGPPATVNAWYSPQNNNINIPSGILNEPFFHANRPMALNFGTIGVVLGHELTHGFDNGGVKWDAYGAYHPEGWMTNHSMAGFKKMAQCVVDEYNEFCFPEIKMCVNGKLTEAENIADNGGVMASYRGYRSQMSLSGQEPRLPEPMSKYSMEQVFFLSFGYILCENITTQALKDDVKYGGHSPDHTRVTETLKNIPQFAAAFDCKPGSNMAPKKHCNVWVNGHK